MDDLPEVGMEFPIKSLIALAIIGWLVWTVFRNRGNFPK